MQCACAVLYCHLWPVWLYNIFPHYLINSTIFEKKFIGHKMCSSSKVHLIVDLSQLTLRRLYAMSLVYLM
jgi:hypothetical protein